jgi:hypothetical protein
MSPGNGDIPVWKFLIIRIEAGAKLRDEASVCAGQMES